ncbi:MAG: hypothetical protein R3B49_06070 [Phycisphaerales bacterium]
MAPIGGSPSSSFTGACDPKNASRSESRRRRSTARSMSWLIATTSARRRSELLLGWTKTWLACSTTWALVMIRSPSMTNPLPVNSSGASLVHGRSKLGAR